MLTIRCLFLAYTANRLSIIYISRGSLVSKVRSSAYNMCETCTPAVPVIAPDTPSAMPSISLMKKGRKQGGQGATLFYPTSRMHTSSLITILQDILITVVRVLNHRQQRRRHASMPKVFPYCIPWNGVIGLFKINESSVQPRRPIGFNCSCQRMNLGCKVLRPG